MLFEIQNYEIKLKELIMESSYKLYSTELGSLSSLMVVQVYVDENTFVQGETILMNEWTRT